MLDVRPVLIDFLQVVPHISSLQNPTFTVSIWADGLDFSHCSALKADFSGRNSRRRFTQSVCKGHLHISCMEGYTTHIALTLSHTCMCTYPFYSEPILHNFTKLQFTWVVQYGFTKRDIWADVLTNNVRQQEIHYFSLSMHFRHIGADIYR